MTSCLMLLQHHVSHATKDRAHESSTNLTCQLVKPKSVLAFLGSFCNAHSVLSPVCLLFSSSCHLRVEFKALEGRLGKHLFNILRVLKESKQRACMLSGPLGSSAGLWTDLREPEVPGLRWFEAAQNKGPL